MKQFIFIIILLFSFFIVRGQLSVRVKESGKSKEVEINTKGKTGTDKNKSTPAKSPSEEVKNNEVDTVAKPATQPDDSYNGPAKTSLKSFWSHIEKLRNGTGTPSSITNAERMIQMVKEKDPNYNIAALEAVVKPWKDKAAKEIAGANDAKTKEEEQRNYFKNIWQKMTGVYSGASDIQPGVTGKNYYQRVEEVNLSEFQERKKELGTIDPKSYAGLVDAMLADYDDYVKRSDRLKWNVTSVVNKAVNAPTPQDKLRFLEEAKYECLAILILSPNNDPFKKKLEEINKMMGNAEGESAKFYTSDFHRENLNKIVWSSKPLIIGKEKEMSSFIKKEFKTGEYIYGTAYLGINVKDVMNGNDDLRIRIRIDGNTAIWGGDLSYVDLPLTLQNRSYLQFALLPDAQWIKDNYGPYVSEENWTISYFLDELVKGGAMSHEITSELIFPTSKISNIKGNLQLDLNAGISDINGLAKKLSSELMSSRQLPKAGMNNSAMENQMVEAANKLGWNDKFSKAIITSSAWTVRKNELTSAIINRTIAAVCITKDNDGKCYYQEFNFSQDYTGGGNYSAVIKFYSYGGKREIGCDKVK